MTLTGKKVKEKKQDDCLIGERDKKESVWWGELHCFIIYRQTLYSTLKKNVSSNYYACISQTTRGQRNY